MSATRWLQILFFVVLLAISTPLLGNYMAKVYANEKAPGDRVFLPIERFVYRVCRIDPESEQRWRSYVISLIVYTLVGGMFTYAILRLQQHLPGNPDRLPNVPAGVSFNTAVSFMTNTNWQWWCPNSNVRRRRSPCPPSVTCGFLSPATALGLGGGREPGCAVAFRCTDTAG